MVSMSSGNTIRNTERREAEQWPYPALRDGRGPHPGERAAPSPRIRCLHRHREGIGLFRALSQSIPSRPDRLLLQVYLQPEGNGH